MAVIYQKCSRNIVYLGLPDKEAGTEQGSEQDFDLTKAFEHIIHFKMREVGLDSRAALEEHLFIRNFGKALDQSARFPPENLQHLAAIIKQISPLFRSPWFGRLWVI